jgi:hypothetical protein
MTLLGAYFRLKSDTTNLGINFMIIMTMEQRDFKLSIIIEGSTVKVCKNLMAVS